MSDEDPEWRTELLNSAAIQTGDEFLAVTLHAYMLQLGFLNKDAETKDILPDFKNTVGSIFKYTFRDDALFQLVVFRHGQIVKIFGLFGGNSYSTTLPRPQEFVHDDGGKFTLARGGSLSRQFKNEVGFPLLQTARLAAGLQSGGLMSLPPEILLQIFYKLNATAALKLGETCWELNVLSKDETIWNFFLNRDFNNLGGGGNLRKLYKTLYAARLERSRHHPPFLLPRPPLNPYPYPDPDPAHLYPDPTFPPGIVGGDYDLYPFGNPLGGRGLRGVMRPMFDPPGPNFPGRGTPRFGPRGGGGGGFGGFF
jgi:F-box protein 7